MEDEGTKEDVCNQTGFVAKTEKMSEDFLFFLTWVSADGAF